MTKVSIIIPVFNVERYLRACLTSVVSQTLQDIEIICVNDASTDRSLDILNEFAQKDDRIKIINNRINSGLSFTRNRGLELSQGDYIYFLDSDDMINPEAMEELSHFVASEDLEGVFFDSTVIFETEFLKQKFSKYQPERKHEYSGTYCGQVLFQQFIQNKDWISMCQCQFWQRKFLFDRNLKFYEGIIHEDELFTFLGLLQANKVACIRKKYFIYRIRENSIMSSKVSDKNVEGAFICYSEMLDFWYKNNFAEPTNKAIDVYLTRLYKHAAAYYKAVSRDMVGRKVLRNGNPITNHLFNLFISDKFGGAIFEQIDGNKLTLIKQYKDVIIYGAGVVARDVLAILDRNEIAIRGFAVTDQSGNPRAIMGTPVYRIEELYEYRDSAIVIVAVIPRNQKVILDKLEGLGFENIIQIS